MNYDVIIIGGGHAGCEAANASAKLGVKTLLLTKNIEEIALPPCNPAIGGPAKGVVVREIDALGGLMGRVSDESMLQIKKLNRSKGPAVHALRSQIDIKKYPQNMVKRLKKVQNLDLKEGFVEQILYHDPDNIEIKTKDGTLFKTKKLIITAGTYMNGFFLQGNKKEANGVDGTPSQGLSEFLKDLGVEIFRLKTGTPARIKKSSVDLSKLEKSPGDEEKLAFSYYEPNFLEKQELCYLLYTNEKLHQLVADNLNLSSMYSGEVTGVGPRYCPSIEDKIVRFVDKTRHQLFLEPESLELDTFYLQGLSNSLPEDIQDKMIRLLDGLENAEIVKYGYAVEYDAVQPTQLKSTLEFKNIANIYTAGQVNGTSGYEEAAGQGLVAGINAALSVLGKEEFILQRTNSYIGLMIDDLTTKGTQEPYRLLTSRSEYRLYLRSDNADQRLSKMGYDIGLLSQKDYKMFLNKLEKIEQLKDSLATDKVTADMIKDYDENFTVSKRALELLKRPKITAQNINSILNSNYEVDILELIEIEVKYAGYIDKVKQQISREDKLFKVKIPLNFDFNKVGNLSLEAIEKLDNIRPMTLGHAKMISGVNPTDILSLQIYLQNRKGEF